MTNEQILKKAINKAIKNGYTMFGNKNTVEEVYSLYCSAPNACIDALIFCHDFAKVIFGKEKVDGVGMKIEKRFLKSFRCPLEEAWQFHLQRMVLEKDPIKYLKKFI